MKNKHYLKSKSMFVVMILKSLRHGGCVNCGKPIKTLEESEKHWTEELKKAETEREREKTSMA